MRSLMQYMLLLGNSGGEQYGPEQTLTLQPDAAAGVDSYVQSNQAATNNANGATLYVGEWSGASFVNRSMMQFDLSSIPANAKIDSATLTLTIVTKNGASVAGTLGAYRLKREWVENQVTWTVYSTGNNWQTAGGFGADDCEQTNIGERILDPAVLAGTEALTWTLDAAKVQEWIDGTLTNNGLLLKMATESDNDFGFASSDHATASARPKLEVIYRIPF